MDLNEFRSFILDSGVDVWTWIDMAISVASVDHQNELKIRRDGIIQKLYTPPFLKCHNCDVMKNSGKNEIYQKNQHVGFHCGTEEDDDNDDDEQRKILEIKILLDDQNQSERCLVDLLQRLVDMDTTFKALKETDIGRHVTKLRKHSSNEVRRLVKVLVRKWKETVDEWVRLNTPMEEEATQFNGDINSTNETHHESLDNDVNAQVLHHHTYSQKRKVKHNLIESDGLVSAGKHHHGQNHQETENAKKQRTTQLMDLHDIPKLKNSIVSNNEGASVPVNY